MNKKLLVLITLFLAQISFARTAILLVNDTDYASDWRIKTSQAWCCGVDVDNNGQVGCTVHLQPHSQYVFDFQNEQKKKQTNYLCLAPCINQVVVTIHERQPFTLMVDQQGQALRIGTQMAWIGGTTMLLGGPVLPALIAAGAAIGIQCFDTVFRVKKVLLTPPVEIPLDIISQQTPVKPIVQTNIPYTYIMEVK